MERQRFLNNLVGPDVVRRIENQISKYGGRVVDGIYGDQLDIWAEKQFGQFDVRIIGVSKGIEKLDVNKTTAIGGWCALRTADAKQLGDKGTITNPLTGKEKRISSVSEVTEWLGQAISIDQIIEAVGIFNGKNYVSISEEKSWGDRIKSDVAYQLRRSLTALDLNQIEDALSQAERLRFEFTRRYLNYATQRENQLIRIVDRDIWDELVYVRNNMLRAANLELAKLTSMFPKDKGIPGYSIVWGMYTGPYLAILKSKGFIKTQKGIIIEPSFHAVGETEAKAYVTGRLLCEDSKNNYLVKGGINKDLGFAAYADLMSPSGDRLTRRDTVDRMPNIMNYKDFLINLYSSPDCASLILANNPAFMWGVNLFPYGRARDALLKMIYIKDAYQTARKTSGAPSISRENNAKRIKELKEEYGRSMLNESVIVINELEKMLNYVFA